MRYTTIRIKFFCQKDKKMIVSYCRETIILFYGAVDCCQLENEYECMTCSVSFISHVVLHLFSFIIRFAEMSSSTVVCIHFASLNVAMERKIGAAGSVRRHVSLTSFLCLVCITWTQVSGTRFWYQFWARELGSRAIGLTWSISTKLAG